MRIFLAGATGAVGTHLIPLLREAGHVVIGTTRSRRKTEHLRAQGVEAEIQHGIALMNEIRGCSNKKVKAALDWRPRYPSWRTGFIEGLG